MRHKFSTIISALSLVGCGSGLNGGPTIEVSVKPSDTQNISLNLYHKAVHGLHAFAAMNGALPALAADIYSDLGEGRYASHLEASRVLGANTISQLESLKVYFLKIQICKSMTTTGTAFNNPQGCSTIYNIKESSDNNWYNNYTAAEAVNDNTSKFMDVIDYKATTEKLSQGAGVAPGEYNFGVITQARPIKIKGEITLADGKTLVTKKGTLVDGTSTYKAMQQLDSLYGNAGTAEESVVEINNGGSWFKFQHPFVVKRADAKSGDVYKLDLVFNPDSLIRGSSGNNAGTTGTLYGLDGTKIDVPLLDLTPVVHKNNETASRETYFFSSIGNDYTYRLELYYITQDNTKTIVGVDHRMLYKTNSVSEISSPYKIFSINTNTNGTIDLLDYNGTAIVKNFKRLNQVGDTGVSAITCSGSSKIFCTSDNNELSTNSDVTYNSSYTLASVTEVK